MRVMLFALLMVLATVGQGTTGARAAATEWQDVAPGVKLRLIGSGTPQPDGRLLIGLEIDMPENIHTYWRVPGETGIPTTLDLAGSSGISAHEVMWPYPAIYTQAGLTDFIYAGHTVLPIALTPSGDVAQLSAALVMGVCSDICVPVQANFSMSLGRGEADPGQELRLAQALAEVPIAWEGDLPIQGARFDTARNALVIERISGEIEPLSVIADADPGGPLFGAPQKSRDKPAIILPLLGGAAPDDRPVRLTFMTDEGAFFLWHDMAEAGSTRADR